MKGKVEIVGNKKRQILDMGEYIYLYVPMTAEERRMFAPEPERLCPCWRFEIPNQPT